MGSTSSVVKTCHIIGLPSNLYGLRARRSPEQCPTMPNKCPFCRRKYSRSGAYEKHLRTAHTSLDIVLASTVQYNNIQTFELLNADASECQHSDYESDPGPAGLEPDAFCPDFAYESDAEVFDTTSACAGKQNHSSAKTDPASDPSALRPDASDVFSASHASCAS